MANISASGIVCCQGQFHVSVKSVHHLFKILDATRYVLMGVEKTALVLYPDSAKIMAFIRAGSICY